MECYLIKPTELREELRGAVKSAVAELLDEREPRKSDRPKGKLTTREAMQRLRCGRTKLYELRKSGQLKASTVGRTLLFDPADVDALIEGDSARQ